MDVPSAVSRARRSLTDAALLMVLPPRVAQSILRPAPRGKRAYSRVEHFLTRQQGCSAHPRPRSVSREAYLRAGTHARQDEPPRDGPRGLQQELARFADATADHDLLGVEDVDGVGDADAE